MEHLTVDGYVVEVGKKFWDNDLKVVQITEVGTEPRPYLDSGETATWHKHTRGISDTLTGNLQWIGRLTRFYQGKDAENYPNDTNYADIKDG